ncbi:maltotransferase domain-containing protein, partial [Streptomyces sp. NPDC005708]|uniref:maltotransferase domain-containing protein n=1 Tax=unclassified Streptomyces TaxID=2593676 RepID=UPI0033CB9A45
MEPQAVHGDGAPPVAGGTRPVIGRIPIVDVRPAVDGGRRPAKAVVGEEFEISATVFREGHDAVAADVVLTDPQGRPGPWPPMRELAPGTDRWGAEVTPSSVTYHWGRTNYVRLVPGESPAHVLSVLRPSSPQ